MSEKGEVGDAGPLPSWLKLSAAEAAFLHLCDFVYLHPEAASAGAVAVRKLEAAVIAEKAAREKRLTEVRKREADRQKAAAEREKTIRTSPRLS